MTAQLDLADFRSEDDAGIDGAARVALGALGARSVATARRRAVFAAVSGGLGALVIVLLHVLPAGRALNPVSEPISNYGLTRVRWLFDVGVIGLMLGLASLLSALVHSGCLRARSPSFAVLSACCVGLVGVVIFPDRTSKGSLTTVAQMHWAAAMLTFGGVALAPALLGHGRAPECSRLPRVARRLSVSAASWFSVLLVGSILQLTKSFPLPIPHIGGLVERALAGTEIIVAAVLTVWAWRGCPCRVRPAVLSPAL